MAGVTELGYLGIGVRDLGAWKAFASEVLGLEVVSGEDPRRCAFRMDYWFERFIVIENGIDDLAFAGWRVANQETFDEVAHRLRRAEIPYEIASTQQAADRHVLGLMTLADPCGVPIEIFFGPRIEPSLPFHPGRRRHGPFVTGESGLGHIVTDVGDPKKCEEFYVGILGMRGSIEYELNRQGTHAVMHFMSCNPRQHSLAFANFRGRQRLSHVMTETARLDDVGLTRDIVKRRGVPIRLDLGQHHNDRAVSFYFVTPSGWNWEVGWGVVPPTGQAEWGRAGIWGHEPLTSPPKQGG